MKLLDKYRAFAVDLDGVVWRGAELLEVGKTGLLAIIATAKPLLLLTNNGAYRPEGVAERLGSAGIQVRPDQVLTTTIVARKWIEEQGMAGKTAFVLGPADITAQLQGLVEVLPIKKGLFADIVLVGRYTDLSYDTLAVAADSVRAGASFISLNNDPIMPVEDGFIPGTGAILSALEAASGAVATVLGKPNAAMMQAAAEVLGTSGVLMVGDGLKSDIAGAQSIGWDSALVLSGLSNKDSEMDPRPTYVLASLADITAPAPA